MMSDTLWHQRHLLIDGELVEASDGATYRTGTMSTNGGVWYGAAMPFSGFKQSGIGREMGEAGFAEHLESMAFAQASG
jgi:acyl-CoA reductase-like NAD-dependent aldehyde dehydrogenase